VESPQAEQNCDTGFRANTTLAANVSFNFVIFRFPSSKFFVALANGWP
jgi:hypothetical protein